MGISIQDVLGSSLLDSVKGIISQFHMSPDDKAKLQAQLDAEKDQFIAAENDYNAKLNDIAGQNIRTEQASGDHYVTRARPSVIWVGLAMIAWNYCVVPFAGLRWHLTPISFPDAFWWTWGTVVTGYVFTRSAQEIAQMPGDSQIKLGPIQIGQKSPPS